MRGLHEESFGCLTLDLIRDNHWRTLGEIAAITMKKKKVNRSYLAWVMRNLAERGYFERDDPKSKRDPVMYRRAWFPSDECADTE